jgi:hypothetical protein
VNLSDDGKVIARIFVRGLKLIVKLLEAAIGHEREIRRNVPEGE